jgi:hypothetical protein
MSPTEVNPGGLGSSKRKGAQDHALEVSGTIVPNCPASSPMPILSPPLALSRTLAVFPLSSINMELRYLGLGVL